MTIIAQIKTRYITVEHSNVGAYLATGLGKQRTSRANQAVSSDANHAFAADRLARAIVDEVAPDTAASEWTVEQFDSNDAGTERLWRLVRTP